MKICDHCKKQYHDFAVRKCPHPSVNRVFGENICRSCCIRCEHHIAYSVGIGCDLLAESIDKKSKT